MSRLITHVLVLLYCLGEPGTALVAEETSPAEQFQAIAKEFNSEGFALRQAKNDADREQIVARVEKLTARLMDLAEKNARQPVAMDALVQVANHEMWMQDNTTHLGRGQDSPEVAAIAILLRDHVQSDKAAEACRRMSYGFRKESEGFIRAVLEKNPHRDVQGLACLRLAQLLKLRAQRLDLLAERPEMLERYEKMFGKEYIAGLRRDQTKGLAEAGALFERAAEKYADVKIPYGTTVGEKARLELHEIRHLSIGKQAPELAGEDQDGKPFKLSDYRGKVVLLYFWSEY